MIRDLDGVTALQLRTFLAIVREGSFTAAGLALDVAQPTVSARMHALEQAVGAPLFVRRGRQVVLTPHGEELFEPAERALRALEEGLQAARRSASAGGIVRVGIAETALADAVLAEAVAQLSGSRPDIQIVAEASACGDLARALHNGSLRLAFVPWPYASPAFDLLRPLETLTERLCFVAPAGHPLARRRVTCDQLARLARPLLVPWWSQPAARVVARVSPLSAAGIELPVATARTMLLGGRGCALLAPGCVQPELAAGALVELDVTDLPEITTSGALVRHGADGDLPEPASALVAAVREAARRHGKQRAGAR
jgi:LysR family transcriptional regulator, low CO2-responsive transcriptional regulator